MSSARQSKRGQVPNGACRLKVVGRKDAPATVGESSIRSDSLLECPGAVRRADILEAYEKLLESHVTPLNRVSALPFSKEAIREAIRDELAENPENELRNHLEMAFVQLESFVPLDDYQLVEDFKQMSCVAQRMARSGDPRDLMESWRLVKQLSGEKVVKIFETISDKMRRRLEEARSIGARSSVG
ncbi:MAG: hypothetical protein AB9873_07005 [Syntrophobacteraceae bacterium]